MVTQRERLIAQGKRQVLLWLSDQAVERLKAICTRERCTQQELVERLIMGYAAQPGTAADSGGDSIDRLSDSISALGGEIAQLADSVRDMAESTEDRLADIEARLSALEATPEAPIAAAPGGNEAAIPKVSAHAPKAELEARRKRIMELNAAGRSTSEISHILIAEGFAKGVRPSDVHKFLYPDGLGSK